MEHGPTDAPIPSPPLMLRIEQVSKRFGAFTALDGITMEVPAGQVFGLLGPNGAGKTTLIRVITRITGPDEAACSSMATRWAPTM